jgi:hypothetical protein
MMFSALFHEEWKFRPIKLFLPGHVLLNCLCQAWNVSRHFYVLVYRFFFLSTIFPLDFGTDPTVWEFLLFIFIGDFMTTVFVGSSSVV